MVKARIKPKAVVREYIGGLKNKIKIDKVIFFGSAAKNKFGRNNDLDIIVLSKNFKKMNFLRRLELLSCARNGNSRKVPMDIIGYTAEEFNKLSKESAVLKEAKQTGKVIWP